MARFHRETKKEEATFVTDRRTNRQNQRQKNNRLVARRGDQSILRSSCSLRLSMRFVSEPVNLSSGSSLIHTSNNNRNNKSHQNSACADEQSDLFRLSQVPKIFV